MKDGVHSWCKECTRARGTKDYLRDKGKIQVKRQRLRLDVLTAYSTGVLRCTCCGETEPQFLALDHIDGGGYAQKKLLRRHGQAFYLWLKQQGYPEGYRVLCHNCNLAKGFYGECPHETKRRSQEAVILREDDPREPTEKLGM